MIIGFMIGLFILGLILLFCAEETRTSEMETVCYVLGFLMLLVSVGLLFFGFFHGFINYPPTEGTHQGTITAVDLEGVWFRRYEVYLKSSAFTTQGDETKYLLYENEKELLEQLQNAIGKQVKLHYGHDGGYIAWNSCGTYHIKSVEIIEE